MPGTLTVVGTGIKLVGQTTLEALSFIRDADKLFYLVADPATEEWLKSQNAHSESLQKCYGDGKPRMQTYQEMISLMLTDVRAEKSVCAAFYGHPGVFVYPSHEAIKVARQEGHDAKMLPGISAEDCLFADIGFDPARHGCQSFEATDFLLFKRQFDPRSVLILWQIGLIGEIDFKKRGYKAKGISLLIERLLQTYQSSHEVVVYEASQYPVCEPRIERTPLGSLLDVKVTPISTLCVPIQSAAEPDRGLAARLAALVAD